MVLSFFESQSISDLYPMALTRPAADMRCGIFTIAEKWVFELMGGDTLALAGAESASGFQEFTANPHFGFVTRDYLSVKFPQPTQAATLYINGHILPTEPLAKACLSLQPSDSLWQGDTLIACGANAWNQIIQGSSPENKIDLTPEITFNSINRPYDIFSFNGEEIKRDFDRITRGRNSQPIPESNRVIGSHPIFIEEGAKLECVILNAKEGPIYIGKNTEIMEGSLVRGPFALCEGAVLKMGTKAYTNSTLGPYSVAGGEISNVVFWGFSNKGHDGFLGNAVLGQWCNIGADTNASNLKNTYDDVKVWNYSSRRFEKSGLQFVGLLMGDHSKCGINTMFNTGTVVGVACNIFGSGFPRNFVQDFSWGGPQGVIQHQLSAVDKTAALVMPRRKKTYTETEKEILHHVFNQFAVSAGE